MKKRIISFVMALVLAVSLLPASVLAADVPAPDKIKITYSPTEGDVQVIGTYRVDADTTVDVRLITVDSKQYNYVSTQNATIGGISINKTLYKVGETITVVTSHKKDSTEYAAGQKFYEEIKDELQLTDGMADKLDSKATQTCFYNYSYIYKSKQYSVKQALGLLIIQWTEGEFVSPDRDKLSDLIDGAPTTKDGEYYIANDRFNGKTSSTSGFWSDYQRVLKTATSTCKSATATQAKIDDAFKSLTAAIDNLIPTTQVNATALYEAATKASKMEEKLFTADTWKSFSDAYSNANDWLSKLFNAEGTATAENLSEKQNEVDEAVAALTEAMDNLYYLSNVSYYQEKADTVTKLLPDLIRVAETARQSDYTPESWAAFSEALTEAKATTAPVLTETNADIAAVKAYEQVFSNLYQQFYYNLTPAGEITVTLTYLDPEMARKTSGAVPRAGATQQVKLSGDYSLYAAVNSLANKPANRIVWPYAKIFINGNYVTEWYLDQTTWDWRGENVSKNIKLHPGDEVTLDINMDPQSQFQPTISGGSAQLWQYIDSIKAARFTQENKLEVKAGTPFTLTVEQAKAALGRDRGAEAGASMALFISDTAEEPSGNYPAKTKITAADGNAVYTGADGSASVTLYHEGWYLIAAYDLQADELGNIENGGDGSCPSYAGTYHCTNSGAAIWVHVSTPEDLSAVKKTLQTALDKVYAAYPESYFKPETWAELKAAYETGSTAISTAVTAGDASDAQQTAISAIKNLQKKTTDDNEKSLANFRTQISKLPEDTSKITASVQSVVDSLIACYEGMSNYQRRQLTGAEIARYNQIKAFVDANPTLPEAKSYNLTLKVVGDTDAATEILNAMTAYLRENPATQDRGSGGGTGTPIKTETPYAFSVTKSHREIATAAEPLTQVRLVSGIDYVAYFQTRRGTFTVDGAKWSISNANLHFTNQSSYGYDVDSGLTVTINGVAYEIKSITYEGIEGSAVTGRTMVAYDDTEYLGKDKDYINMRFGNAAQEFVMPYNDVTVTITWGPVTNETVQAARVAAISRLDTLKNTLGSKAAAAYDKGVANIRAAASVADAESAYQAAVVAMRAAANNYGKVQVIVENTTYAKANGAAWDGILVNTWVDLNADSTMMSCVTAALKTKNATAEGAESNYISSINGLKEFDGANSAGWMGTLNDWFTNEGFGAFTVKSGKLASGDVIRICSP